jgi:hypothetical protein
LKIIKKETERKMLNFTYRITAETGFATRNVFRKTIAFVLCVAAMTLIVLPSSSVSAITGTWTSPTSGVPLNQWRSVTYGAGLFVAVSANGTNRVMTSPDGITWTARVAAEANQWQSVTYGNGVFVAVSDNGTNRVMTSSDGITWTARAASGTADNSWRSVTFGDGKFVATSPLGTNRVMVSSDNGATWTQPTTLPPTQSWFAVTYGNGVFVAVSTDGTNRVMTSPDGITWTPRSAAANNSWFSVTYGDGVFVAVAYDGANRVMTSTDNGATWVQPAVAPSTEPWYSVTYGNGVLIAVAWTSNKVMTSTDNGATWTSSTSTVSSVWNSVTYANGVFLAVADTGSSLVKRLDLTPSTPVTTNLRCVNSKTLVDVSISSEGGSPVTHYEYHISTSFPASQPTQWTAFSPAQNTSPLEWDMQALGYPAGVLHFYYIRAVNSFGASVGSWRSNIRESCTNSFRTTTATTTPPASTDTGTTSQASEPTPSPAATTTVSSSPGSNKRNNSSSTTKSGLPDTGIEVKHLLAIVVILWMFGVGVLIKTRRRYQGVA